VVAREEGRYGIRANVISIGLTDTEQAREAFASWGEAATQKVIDAIPLKRIGRPEEIANMAAFLASENGAYVTGKVIQVDGGQMIAEKQKRGETDKQNTSPPPRRAAHRHSRCRYAGGAAVPAARHRGDPDQDRHPDRDHRRLCHSRRADDAHLQA